MKVRATQPGLYGHLRAEGDVFDFVPRKKPKGFKGEWKGEDLPSWVEAVEAPAPEPSDPNPDGEGEGGDGEPSEENPS